MSHSSPIDESATEETPTDTVKERPKVGQRVSRRPAVPSSGGWKSRWPTLLPLALAAIAVAIAIAAYFRPMHATAPSFSSQQTADAKTHLCAAYVTVRQGVVTNTHLANPVPNDPAGQLAVAANARLALIGGGAFLQNRLTAEPAASGDLAKTVGSMANTIQELGVGYLAGLNSTLDPLRHNLDTEITDMNKLCE